MRSSYRVTFAGGHGATLAGIVDRPTAEPPQDGFPVVVFSHCFTCNKDLKAIVRIARAMAESGVVVLRYDMTGWVVAAAIFRKPISPRIWQISVQRLNSPLTNWAPSLDYWDTALAEQRRWRSQVRWVLKSQSQHFGRWLRSLRLPRQVTHSIWPH